MTEDAVDPQQLNAPIMWNTNYNCYTSAFRRFKSSWSHVYELSVASGAQVYNLKTLQHGILQVKINDAAAAKIHECSEHLLVIIASDYFENFFSARLGGRVTSSQVSPLIMFYPNLMFTDEDNASVEISMSCPFIQSTDEELSSCISLVTTKPAFVIELQIDERTSNRVITFPEADSNEKLWNSMSDGLNKVTVQTASEEEEEEKEERLKRHFIVVLKELPTGCFISSFYYRQMRTGYS